MSFDAGYEPVVMGKTIYVGSSHDDSVAAFDTESGAEKWRFYADGPVRFAPVAWNGKVCFACDDGCLYGLDAAKGSLLWKHRGFPSGRKVLGNERLISPWPARGGPVLADGKVYFAAGIWPFMGVSVQALDAETGKVLWINDEQGFSFINQPHNSPAFGGIAPQGYLAAAGERLVVPGGRSVPAGFDRSTGKMLYYRLAEFGKVGNAFVSAYGDCFFNAGLAFALDDGGRVEKVALGKGLPVLADEGIYFTDKDKTVRAMSWKPTALKVTEKKVTDPKTGKAVTVKVRELPMTELWTYPCEDQTLHIRAGSRLYLGGRNAVSAVDLPGGGGKPSASWKGEVKGTPFSMLAADEKLFVVTLEGGLYCFGGKETKATAHSTGKAAGPGADSWTKAAGTILEKTGAREGYALCLGLAGGRLVEELARQSKLHLIAVDADPKKVDLVRRDLAAKGLYGSRVAVHAGDPLAFEFPPYLASLVVSEDLAAAGLEKGRAFAERLFHPLRPYGGTACLAAPAGQKDALAKAVAEANLAGAKLDAAGEYVLLSRPGALPGAGDWTHQHADAAKTCVSRDRIVKAPLGLLWFGGPSHTGILPRHGHGPAEQVVDGRLLIEGADLLRALDVYTGRVLWEAELPGVGAFYDNTSHQPGANSLGGNYASAADGVYVIYRKGLLRLDPATGKRIGEFVLPAKAGDDGPPAFGTLSVWEDLIIAGARPLTFACSKGRPGWLESWDRTSSATLVGLDRHSGAVLWSREAALGFLHNAIAVGGGKVFCVDALPPGVLKDMKKRNETPKSAPKLLCLNARKGETVWSVDANVFGTWLGYSEEHDVLIQSGRRSRDMFPDDPDGRVITHRGKDGAVLWDKPLETEGPPMIHGRTLITQRKAYDLLSGEEKMREDPLTGARTPFRVTRNYGCNALVGSTNLLTFRSAAAGYFDLANDGGTANLGGFKSGCTSNLIVANGVLNAPDYTRTCVCSYQNQSSLALVHMPDVEMWTFADLRPGAGPVKRVGINFGAPGDRRAEDGTLWLDYPSVGGPSPEVKVEVRPKNPEWFRKHSARLAGDGLKWVAASGAKGITSAVITLGPSDEAGEGRPYTVRLHFAEPDGKGPGERVFDVSIQGQPALSAFDIAKEAGGPDRAIVKEFKGVRVKGALAVGFAPSASAKDSVPVICGLEAVAQ